MAKAKAKKRAVGRPRTTGGKKKDKDFKFYETEDFLEEFNKALNNSEFTSASTFIRAAVIEYMKKY